MIQCKQLNKRERERKKRLTCDGETAKAPFLLEGLGLLDGGAAVDNNGIEDEAVFVTLHLANHVSLLVGGAVVVDDTNTTLKSHVNGHLVLRDSVHGGRHEGSLEGDTLGDGRVENDLGSREANVSWQQQEIIVCQATMLGGVHELVDVEAIMSLVVLEQLECLGVVEDLGSVDGRHFGLV